MKASFNQISVMITLPDTGSPKREPFSIWINPTHRTWGTVHGDPMPGFLSRKDTDFINDVVDKVSDFSASLEKMGSNSK